MRALWTLLAAVLVLAACGSSAAQTDDTASDSTASSSTQPDSDVGGGLVSEVAASETDPQGFRGEIGRQVAYECPAAGSESAVWGVELYTDDSSVCSAAVHVGLLTFADGGRVLIEIAGGQEIYESGIANGLESRSYGNWAGSFFFPEAPPGSGQFEASTEAWRANATGRNPGEEFTFECPADGELGSVWGSGKYTADSSVCTAAVHAGLITTADGGPVEVYVTEGSHNYEGTEANGVTTRNFGTYGLSFTLG